MGSPLLHGQYAPRVVCLCRHCPAATADSFPSPHANRHLRAPCQALDPVDESLTGVIICKLEHHASHSPPTYRGYIAMLAVSSAQRGRGIATALVRIAIDTMARRRADEIVLETEDDNHSAMRLYERLGFLRSKKLHRYYLNGNSAYRLVLLLRPANADDFLSPSLSSLSSLDDLVDPAAHYERRERDWNRLPTVSGAFDFDDDADQDGRSLGRRDRQTGGSMSQAIG